MASVSLLGVHKRYRGGTAALVGLDLQVEAGESLVLVGPSGCGKSTTLRLIAGLEEPTAGEIRIDGRVVNGVPPQGRDVAMVFQSYALYPQMSVYKNMAFSLRRCLEGRVGFVSRVTAWWRWLNGSTDPAARESLRREMRQRVLQAAQLLGIEDLLGRMPSGLSGGERQRVALGRALVRRPAVFLLDEPLSNLDAKLRWETRRELKQLHRQLEATMVYVTHDQAEAMALGQRLAVLDRGRLQQVGTPAEIYRRPANQFVAGFIGMPPMNLLPGEIVDLGGRLVFESPGLRVPLSDGWQQCLRRKSAPTRVVLGIRPEHLEWTSESSADDASCAAIVTLVEVLGETAYVHGKVAAEAVPSKNAEGELVCSTDAARVPRGGERIRFAVAARQAQLFDAATGRNLRWEEPEEQ